MRSWSVLVLAFTAGCIPVRDNENDPVNAPVASLRVIDQTLPDGGCSALSADGTEVFQASKLRCLTLDARRSTDPQTASEDLDYTFALVSTNGGADLFRIAITNSAGRAVLDETFRRTVQNDAALVFDVVVGDGESTVTATATLEILNEPPVAIGDAPRSFPLGGNLWALGEPFRVTFASRGSTDPDGDPLVRHCWTFPETLSGPAGEVCDSVSVTREFDSTIESAIVVSYRVEDATESSEPVPVKVRIATPDAWIGDYQSGALHTRFDATHTVESEPDDVRFVRGAMYDDGVVRRFVVGAGVPIYGNPLDPDADYFRYAGISLHSWPEGEVLGTPVELPAPSTVPTPTVFGIDFAPDPAHQRIWGYYDNEYESTVVAWTVSNGAVVLTPELVVPSTYTNAPFGERGWIDVDAAGVAWVRRGSLSHFLSTVEPDGTLTERHPDDTRVISSVGPRPASPETWIIDLPNPLNSSPIEFRARLLRYASAAASTPDTVLELPADRGYALHWVDADHFWMSLDTDGIVLVDAAMLESGADFDAAIVSRAPDVFDVTSLVVDPATGTAWARQDNAPILYRLQIDGTVDFFEDPEGVTPLFVDPKGTLWYDSGSRQTPLRHGASGSISGRITSIETPGGGYTVGTRDSLTGGVWLSSSYPASLFRFAEDGTMLDHFTRVRVGTTDYSFPTTNAFAASGTRAWVSDLDPQSVGGFAVYLGLLELDLSTNPPTQTRILLNSNDGNFENDVGGDFTVGSSPNGDSPFFWVWKGYPLGIYTMDVPVIDPVAPLELVYVPVEGDTNDRIAAISLRSNKLCVANNGYPINPINPRNFSLSRLTKGVANREVLIADSSQPWTADAIAAPADATRDTCVVAYGVHPSAYASDPDLTTAFSRIEGWTAAGVPTHPVIIENGGYITSLDAHDPDHLWATKRVNQGAGTPIELVVLRFDWQTETGQWKRTEMRPGLGDSFLLSLNGAHN